MNKNLSIQLLLVLFGTQVSMKASSYIFNGSKESFYLGTYGKGSNFNLIEPKTFYPIKIGVSYLIYQKPPAPKDSVSAISCAWSSHTKYGVKRMTVKNGVQQDFQSAFQVEAHEGIACINPDFTIKNNVIDGLR